MALGFTFAWLSELIVTVGTTSYGMTSIVTAALALRASPWLAFATTTEKRKRPTPKAGSGSCSTLDGASVLLHAPPPESTSHAHANDSPAPPPVSGSRLGDASSVSVSVYPRLRSPPSIVATSGESPTATTVDAVLLRPIASVTIAVTAYSVLALNVNADTLK